MSIYILLNKPKGFITTTSDEHGRPTVMDLIGGKDKVFPVGRLDENTSGLLILTDDGQFSNLLTHPSHSIGKTYRLTVRGFLPKPVIKKFEQGVQLQDGVTSPAIVKLIKRESNMEIFELTIFEGRNRQIRRMCGKLGLELLNLKRVAIGPLRDDSLKEGNYRYLLPDEIENLKNKA
jgi:23S rRNA pseudouridine2605 synthase